MKRYLVCLAFIANSANGLELQPFTASYLVHWKGMTAGSSTVTLSRGQDNHWTYETRNIARGPFRVVLPGDITQHSEFILADGAVQPLLYRGDDGRASTKRDIDIHFDWTTRRVTGIYEDKRIDMPIEPGVWDDLSVQLALMVELSGGKMPTGFRLVDRDLIKDYLYTREGDAAIDTALGRMTTALFRSRRPGAQHSTLFWCAPDLGYLPVKVERQDGKNRVEWSMAIESQRRGP
ncbi:MAG: DUF3108 domain-containing protein [Pseudomonadota bacterium]